MNEVALRKAYDFFIYNYQMEVERSLAIDFRREEVEALERICKAVDDIETTTRKRDRDRAWNRFYKALDADYPQIKRFKHSFETVKKWNPEAQCFEEVPKLANAISTRACIRAHLSLGSVTIGRPEEPLRETVAYLVAAELRWGEPGTLAEIYQRIQARLPEHVTTETIRKAHEKFMENILTDDFEREDYPDLEDMLAPPWEKMGMTHEDWMRHMH